MQHAADDRLAFTPPPQPALVRAFVLAVIAHLLLLVALMHGLQWQRESETVAAEAELWSAMPQQAAPKAVEAPPPPPPPPPVVKAPPKPEPPVVKAPPKPEPPAQKDPDIALEREKQKREIEKRKQAEAEKRELEKRRQAEAEKRERDERRKLEAEKKREDELAKKKQDQAKLLAENKRKEEDRKRKQQEQDAREAREAREARDAKRLAQLREENLKRIQGMAGTGAPGSSGSAAQSSGPSASWGAKVQARVRPNIVFMENASGNPKAEVEVRTSPDGTIVGKRLVRSSGNKSWDDAVLRALDKTESLPRDIDGRVPSPVVIGFRPRD